MVKQVKKFVIAIVLAGILAPTACLHAMQSDDEGYRATDNEEDNELFQGNIREITYAMIEAVMANDEAAVRQALNVGAIINAQHCFYSCSALKMAARHGYTNIVKLLLENKADINICNDSTDTPLKIACWHKHMPTAITLVIAGAKMDLTKDKEYYTRTPDMLTELLKAKKAERDTQQALALLKPMVKWYLQDHPQVTLEDVTHMVGRFLYYDSPEYEFLNRLSAQEWSKIKKELEISLLIETHFLPVAELVTIVDEYLFRNRQKNRRYALGKTQEVTGESASGATEEEIKEDGERDTITCYACTFLNSAGKSNCTACGVLLARKDGFYD